MVSIVQVRDVELVRQISLVTLRGRAASAAATAFAKLVRTMHGRPRTIGGSWSAYRKTKSLRRFAPTIAAELLQTKSRLPDRMRRPAGWRT
jgi:hypothetical protein